MKLSNLSSVGFDSATRVRAWMQQAPGSVLLAMRRLLPQTCTLCGIASGDSLLCISCSVALPSLVCACPVCALPAPTCVGLRGLPRPAAAVQRRDRAVGLCVPGRPSGARIQVRRPARAGRAASPRRWSPPSSDARDRRPMPSSRCRSHLRVSAIGASTRRVKSPGAWRKRSADRWSRASRAPAIRHRRRRWRGQIGRATSAARSWQTARLRAGESRSSTTL